MATGDGGGIGNERGSAHRRGLAVLLAANGLVDRALTLPSGEGFVPARLEFETDQPTDDVMCIATSGARVFFSAKRTCGDDAQNLGKTVAQWVQQAPSLQPGDILGLATAQLTGAMQHIRAALQRHHHQPGTDGPVDEQNAMTALKDRIKAAAPTDPELQARVLDAAYVLVVSAVGPEDEDFQVAADRLENKIVLTGQGLAAAGALSQAFHTQAAQKSGSGVADWVRILRDDAQLTVFSDAQGPAGAAENARQLALRGYVTRLGEQLGRIEVSLLAEDVEPLTVMEVADGLRVAVPGSSLRSPLRQPERASRLGRQPDQEPLLAVARRWPRLLLTGLPGMGKSTALRQLAARWASDDDAPLPILVSLPGVAERCAQAGEVTLSVLCEVAAAQSAPVGPHADLAAALQTACQDGHVVLLLDAFDEVGHRRPVLADGIKNVLAALPAQVGVVLATRDVGRVSAARLGLPEAELISPANLETVQGRLLEHIAATRVADAERGAWLSQRRRWARAARREHRDIAQVPLLATLMTLVVADSATAPAAPRGAAELLVTAVQRSVLRWEQHLPHALGARQGEPTSAQLLDGFAAVGRLLAAGSASRTEAEQAVTAMLDQQWGVSAPGPAREFSAHILRFWDEHVGVFVDTGDRIEARSRVFAEIGAAMAVSWLSEEELAAWVRSAVTDPDRRTEVLLAGELEPRVLSNLLAHDGDAGTRALPAAMVARRRLDVADDQRVGLLQLLIDAADQAAAGAGPSGATQNPGTVQPQRWTYVAELAFLRLPPDWREHRRQALTSQCADQDERVLAAGLVALADAAADSQSLTAEQVTAVRQALTLAPQESPVGAVPKNRGRRLRGARLRIAQEAVSHLQDLGDDMVPHIRELARLGRLGDSVDVEHALRLLGYDRQSPAPGAHVADRIDQLFGGIEQDAQVLPLLHAAQLIAPAGDISTAERWRLPQLCALFDLIDVRGSDFDGFLAFGTEPVGTRVGWLTAVATAAGLDLTAVAAQAHAAAAEQARGQQPTVWVVLTAPAPAAPPTVDAGRLSAQDADELLVVLVGGSQWMAESARRILWNHTDDQLSARLRAALDRLPDDQREFVAELARRISSDVQDGEL